MPLLDLLAADELVPGRAKVVRAEGRTLALFREEDEVHALEDECPRDGFALSTGEVSAGAVRCGRHGGRFELSSGRCLRGGEDVRRYHARIENGRVLVLVEEPLAEVEQARLTASVRNALIDCDVARLGRECVRLLAAGAEPRDVLRLAVRYGVERAQGGFHRSLAACADLGRIAPLYEGFERAVPLTQALVGVATTNRGRSQRPIPGQARGVLQGAAEHRRQAFVRLVEQKDAEGAEAMLSGALYQGLAASEAQQWLLAAVAAQPTDDGHTLVHVVKALELCDQLGMREAIYILPPLVPPLVFGVRDEDSEPFRQIAAQLEKHRDHLPNLLERADAALGAAFDDRSLRNTLLDGSATGVFDGLLGALEAGVPVQRLAVSVAMAAAERILRFDDRLEWDDARDQGWEDVVHPLVHAVATLRAVVRWPVVGTLRCLFNAAARVQSVRDLDLPAERRPSPPPAARVPADGQLALAAVSAAVRTRRASEALALARGYLERGHDPWRLAELLARTAVEDALPTQGAVETGVLTVIAAIDAWESAGARSDQALPLIAATRYLASDGRRRFTQRAIAREIARQKRLGRAGTA